MRVKNIQNSGRDHSEDEVKDALETLSKWLREGVTVGIFNEETNKCELLKPFDSKKAFILGALTYDGT